METFDVAVLGAGPGGYPAAIRASQLGARVVLIEKENLGGACLNWGCIPSKTLISSARLLGKIQSAAQAGIVCAEPRVDYSVLIDHKDRIVEKLRSGVKQLLASNGVTVLKGAAAFQTRHLLEIRDGDGEPALVETSRTIIAVGAGTGTETELPKHERILDSRSFLELRHLPVSALIVGGGIVGCEYACLLGQFGVQVTVVESSGEILDSIDPDLSRELKRHMEKSLGVRILPGTSLREVKVDTKGVRAFFSDGSVEVEVLVDTTRRIPATGRLELAKARVLTDAKGYIPVDLYGQTSAASVYAIGDVTGGPQLAHAATSQGLTAAENACGSSQISTEEYVPCCIFSDPEIASVGLSERQAKAQGRKIAVGKFRLGALGRSLITGDSGFVKWIADADTSQLLGAAAVGPSATEMIAEAAVAIRGELTARELARTSHAHPTLSEAWFESAAVLLGQPIHTAPRKR